jgi:hypothetical protein
MQELADELSISGSWCSSPASPQASYAYKGPDGNCTGWHGAGLVIFAVFERTRRMTEHPQDAVGRLTTETSD